VGGAGSYTNLTTALGNAGFTWSVFAAMTIWRRARRSGCTRGRVHGFDHRLEPMELGRSGITSGCDGFWTRIFANDVKN